MHSLSFMRIDTWYANPIDQIDLDAPSRCVLQLYISNISAAFRSRFQTIPTNLIIVHFRKRLAGRLLIPLKPIDTPRPLNGQLTLFHIRGDERFCLVLSGQHLHQTCLRPSQSQVSLDFRCCLSTDVPLPLNVDNRSSGSTKDDFMFIDTKNLVP